MEVGPLEKTYRKLIMSGLLLLLTAFALLIFKPTGTSSVALGAVLFAVSFLPLELARRVAARIAVEMREEGKA